MAKAAADVNYQPTEAFRRLPNFKSYQQLWEEKYKNKIFLENMPDEPPGVGRLSMV